MNYNINFTYNYTDVAYMYYGYQDYNASASCEGCSLNDSFIGINRHAAPPWQPSHGYICRARAQHKLSLQGLSKSADDHWRIRVPRSAAA